MARFEAQKWQRRVARDGYTRELVTAWSFPTREEADNQAVTFAEELQAGGFELELVENAVHATRGEETIVVCVGEKEY